MRQSALLLCLALILFAAFTFAENQTAKIAAVTYHVTRATSEIKIDGNLDEQAWKDALTMPLAFETRPGENIPAKIKTDCKLTYDDNYLYGACYAHDPKPDQIRAHYTDRDNATNDDFVGFVLDPFNDGRRAFEFFVNPFGVQMDFINDDVTQNEDSTWDAIWQSAGRITEYGYIIEIAVPFTSLRFPKGKEIQTWGIDIVRIWPRNMSYRLGLEKIDRNISCYLCQESKLQGFVGIHPGQDIELDPTYTANRTDELPENGSVKSDVGLSARWGITPNLGLNAAINPDFSQVEADVAQLSVNTRFALFFPEKRPFFLEGSDLFSTLLRITYTRTIADPSFGLKVTSKSGSNAIGALVSRDDVTNLVLPANQSSQITTLDEPTTSAFLRYRRDIGESTSTVGFLYNDREGTDYTNRVFGTDGRIHFWSTEDIRFQALGSQTRYPDSIVQEFGEPDGTLDSGAISFRWRHASRNWFWRGLYEEFGKDFRADSGFIPRVDTRQFLGTFERDFVGSEKNWYSLFYIGTEESRITDHTGLLTDAYWSGYFGFNGPLQSSVNVVFQGQKEYFEGVTYDEFFTQYTANLTPTGYLNISITGKNGDTVDYDNARPATVFQTDPIVTINMGRHLQTSLDYTYLRLNSDVGHVFTAGLGQWKLIYQFNVRMFVRAILQYTDIKRNLAVYVNPADPRSRQLFTQFLFSYKINPQSVFFLGYSDNREDQNGQELVQTERTGFLKVGYAILF
jgi:hypothetical protein